MSPSSRKNTLEGPAHVVLAVYDASGTYSQYAGVVMQSACMRTTIPLHFHILHDETLTTANREKFELLCQKNNQHVEFHNMTAHLRRLSEQHVALVAQNFSIGSLFRLFIPEVITFHQIIYLDCDLIVNLDLRDLWEVNIKDKCLAAVLDPLSRRPSFPERVRFKWLHCPKDRYFNSGVLLMNLDRIRQGCDLATVALEWLMIHKHVSCYPDQDFLNVFFCNETTHIDNRFNRIRRPNETDDAIIHFAGSKPWQTLEDSAAEILFWNTMYQTPWYKERLDQMLPFIFSFVHKSTFWHRHSVKCYQKVALNIKENLTRPFRHSFAIAKLFMLEALYRFRGTEVRRFELSSKE